MKLQIQYFRTFTLGLLCGATALLPVAADDTDIYFGGISATDVKPNVLFILDNSGSMGSRLGDRTRMQVMKDSFRSIMAGASGFNAGIMRFNDPGGSLMFPVTDVEAMFDGESIIVAEPGNVLDLASLNSAQGALVDGGRLLMGQVPKQVNTLSAIPLARNEDDAEKTIDDIDIKNVFSSAASEANGNTNFFHRS